MKKELEFRYSNQQSTYVIVFDIKSNTIIRKIYEIGKTHPIEKTVENNSSLEDFLEMVSKYATFINAMISQNVKNSYL